MVAPVSRVTKASRRTGFSTLMQRLSKSRIQETIRPVGSVTRMVG